MNHIFDSRFSPSLHAEALEASINFRASWLWPSSTKAIWIRWVMPREQSAVIWMSQQENEIFGYQKHRSRSQMKVFINSSRAKQSGVRWPESLSRVYSIYKRLMRNTCVCTDPIRVCADPHVHARRSSTNPARLNAWNHTNEKMPWKQEAEKLPAKLTPCWNTDCDFIGSGALSQRSTEVAFISTDSRGKE